MTDKEKVDKVEEKKGLGGEEREQGREKEDGSGRNFDGQGGQKEAGTDRGEGTGYTES